MGIAYLHLKTVDFFEMRVCHFFNAINYFFKQQNDNQRFTAELLRMQTTDLINIQLAKKDKIKPNQLWTLPWDEQEEETQLTDEQIAERNNEIIKLLTQQNG